jgi:hypothetical protein
MAYSKTYLLERIIEIQNIVLEYGNKGYSQIWTFRHVIKPRFMMSEATFKKYMGRNAKRELKELNENEEPGKIMD